MEYEELRQAVKEHPKYAGCIEVPRAPLITPGFPGTFNLSFSEDLWLEEFGTYVGRDHDFIFSAIQTCIRPNDLPLLRTEDSWKYLGVFELADLTGMISTRDRPNYEQLQQWQVANLVNFLSNVGISPGRIHPSYSVGGTVEELTKGKYTFDFKIPEDTISREAFLEGGVPEENLIPDRTRNTFLSLHLHRPTPWGYRNEIQVDVGNPDKKILLDIGTIEYSQWVPIYRNSQTISKNIVGLETSNERFSILGLGLERLCMAVNDLPTVRDVDYISDFYDAYETIDSSGDELSGESLRALHRIFSDVTSYDCKVGRHQNDKIKVMIRNIPSSISPEQLRDLLQVHTDVQPWHDNLQEGIEPTIERIERYRKVKGV